MSTSDDVIPHLMRNPGCLIELLDSPIKLGNDRIYNLFLPKLSFKEFFDKGF